MQFAPKFLFFVPQYRDVFFADFDLYIGGETGKLRNLGFRQCKTIIMPLIPISYSSVSCCRRCLRCAQRCPFCSEVSCWLLLLRCSRWIWSRHSPEDFHFANYRFSFRKLPIFIFVSFHLVSQTTVSFCFKPSVSRCLLFSKMNSRQENRSNLSFYSQNYNWYSSASFFLSIYRKN